MMQNSRINAKRIRPESIQTPFGLTAGFDLIPPVLLILSNIIQGIYFIKVGVLSEKYGGAIRTVAAARVW
jgi:hypothetical protein